MHESNQASPLNWFDSIRYLNLDKHSNRRKRFLEFCNLYRIDNVTKVSATVHPQYWKGAGRSHQLAVEQANSAGHSNVLVFEDDCSFVNYNAESVQEIINYLALHYWEYMAFSFTFIGSFIGDGKDKSVDLSLLEFLREKGALRRVNNYLMEFNLPSHLEEPILKNKHFLANSCCVAYNRTIFNKFILDFDPERDQVMDQWSPKHFRCLVPSIPFVMQNTPDKSWHMNQITKLSKYFNNVS